MMATKVSGFGQQQSSNNNNQIGLPGLAPVPTPGLALVPSGGGSSTSSNKIITIYIGDNGVDVGQTILKRRWSTYIELLRQLPQLREQLLLLPQQQLQQLQQQELLLEELLREQQLLLQPLQQLLQPQLLERLLERLQELLQEQYLAVCVTNTTDIKTTMNMIKQKVGNITDLAFFNVIGDLDSPKYYEVLSSINKDYSSIKILNICILPEKTRVINPRVDNQILYNVSAIGNFTDSTILIEYDKIIEIVEKEKGEVVNTTHITDKIADILSYYMYVMFINKRTRQTHHEILDRIPLEKGIATLAYVDDIFDKEKMANKLTTDYLVGYKKSTTIYRQVICDDKDVIDIIDKQLNTSVKTAGVLTTIARSLHTELPPTDLPPRGLTIVIDTGIKEFFSGLKRKLEVKNDDIIKEIYSNVAYTKDTLPIETNLELLISRYIAYSYIGQIYQDNTQDITNLDKILDEWLGSVEERENIIDKLNKVLTEINNNFKSSSTSPNVLQYSDNIFDNLDDFFSTIVLPPFLVVNGVKNAVTALDKVLSKTKNKFILTNNIIYQIIKQNDFSILKDPKALKDILEISIESGKSLPINSPYLKIVGSIREVEGINKIDLEILRLDRLDDIEGGPSPDNDRDLAAAVEALAGAEEALAAAEKALATAEAVKAAAKAAQLAAVERWAEQRAAEKEAERSRKERNK